MKNVVFCEMSPGCALYPRSNVSAVKYELGFYISDDAILHSQHRESLKSYIVEGNISKT
jgi:hypothetical protein